MDFCVHVCRPQFIINPIMPCGQFGTCQSPAQWAGIGHLRWRYCRFLTAGCKDPQACCIPANHQRRRGALCENNHISSTPLWLLQSQESQLWRDSTSYKTDQLQKSRLRPFLTFFIFGVVITSILLVVLIVVFVLLLFVVIILLR